MRQAPVEEDRFSSDYLNRLSQYTRYIELVPISKKIEVGGDRTSDCTSEGFVPVT